MPRHFVIVALTVLPLAGCDSNAEKFKKGITPVVEKHREPVKKQLERLLSAQKAASEAPPIKPIESAAGGDFFLIDDSMKLDEPGSGHPKRPPGCHPFYSGGEVFAIAGGYVPGPRSDLIEPKPEHFAEREADYTKYEAVRYALVCKQIAAERPKEEAGGTFSGATYKGECRAFELDGTKYIGGFDLDVTPSSATGARNNSVTGVATTALGEAITREIGTKAKALGQPVAASMSCGWP